MNQTRSNLPFAKRLLRSKAAWTTTAIAAVVLLIAALGGRKPVPVRVVHVEPGDLRVVVNATTTSTVKSENEVTLSAQRTGRVMALPVKEGDVVHAGQLIARLDLTEDEVQSESTLQQSKAAFEEAKKNLARMQDLFAKGMIAQQDMDGVRKTFAVAQSQYEAAQEDLRVTRGYSIIRAPFSGVIATKSTEVGELLVPGKQIVTIVDPNRIYVLATIDEVDVGRLSTGLPVTITVDAFRGKEFAGVVRRISPIVSGGKLETRTADVWIYFDHKEPGIKPGMSADVEILVKTLHGVLSVPSQAVVDRDGKKQLYVAAGKTLVSGDTTVVALRPVTVGEMNWSFTQIVAGIAPGDFIVTTPEANGLKNGARVRIE